MIIIVRKNNSNNSNIICTIYIYTYIHNYNMCADSPSNNNDTQLLQDRKPPIWRVLSDRLSQISTKVAVKPVFSSCDLYSWKERIVAEVAGDLLPESKTKTNQELEQFRVPLHFRRPRQWCWPSMGLFCWSEYPAAVDSTTT